MNRNSHVEPVELTESMQQDSGVKMTSNYQSSKEAEDCEEFRVINKNNLPSKENLESSEFHTNNFETKENEVNDIREIEEELKRNLIQSNSNFVNPTLEEPSPGTNHQYGGYPDNMMRNEIMSQPPPFPPLNLMQSSKSHQQFKIDQETVSNNDFYNKFPLRDSNISSTPKGYNYAVNDKISMFSTQDRNKPQIGMNKLNTSDIVEYNYDPPAYQNQPGNHGDTLERDFSPYMSGHKAYTVNADPIPNNYHSFNPETAKTEAGETNAETHNDPNHPFNYDARNLFSIEDLKTKENKPLRGPNTEAKSQKNHSGTRKIRPIDLPMTTFKAQKHKKLIEEGEKYNTNKISADSPIRQDSESQK